MKPRRKMGGLALALTVFCCVSGGPYGLEQMISSTGAGIGLLMIVLIPIVWALPDALCTAELASAIPEEGGYVIWVRRAMGPFWSFVNAWWSWLYTLVDAAGYPVLFTTYLSKLIVSFHGSHALEVNPWLKWTVSAVVVIAFTAMNVRGTKLVGKASSAFAVIIVVPFVFIALIGFARAMGHPVHLDLTLTPPDPKQGLGGAFSSGLAVIMWNYLGWDALSTIAEEVEDPQRAYPRALLFGIPLVTLIYLLPVLAGLLFLPDPSAWTEGSWPDIAKAVAGDAMGVVVSVVGLVSAVALFTASLLGSSRVPFVLAEERFLPKELVAIHPRFGTPWRALLVCGAVYLVLIYQKFQDLVTVNVILYAAALVLELASLLILRVKEPDLPRPFRIRGGWPVLIPIFLLPTLTLILLVLASFNDPDEGGWKKQGITASILVSGPIIYAVVRWWQRRTDAYASN